MVHLGTAGGKMKEKECPICNKKVKGNGLGALYTNYRKHMQKHKLYTLERREEDG